MKLHVSLFAVIFALVCQAASLKLETLPEWTNKYGDPAKYLNFYNVPELMTRYSLTRLQAVTVQSKLRLETLAKDTLPTQTEIEAAVQTVKTTGETPVKVAALEKAEFIVVLDMDETLYEHNRTNAKCSTYHFTTSNKKEKFVLKAPYAEQLIRDITAENGAVVLFSANKDALTSENLSHWMMDGVALPQHPLVSGLLMNSYLVVYPKEAKPSSLIIASKDLRLLDESLNKVIIVDDSPGPLFQPRNHRLVKKFYSDQYCAGNADIKAAFDHQLEVVSREIKESAEYARKAKVPFAQSYLPYSMIGETTRHWLIQSNQWSNEQAVQFLREHPQAVDPSF